MARNDVARLRLAKHLARQDYERQVLQDAGAGSSDYGSAGPPTWNRAAWDAFRAQYGYYPFGHQGSGRDGGYLSPPTFAGAPNWVYELMGLRKPPITVQPQ